jgi:hypothetical protein
MLSARNAILFLLFVFLSCSKQQYEPRNGDIVFQTSRSAQSRAIQLATKSPYSHMGIVYIRDGRPFVFEAVQPVKLTPLQEWIRRGEGQHFVAKRLISADSVLTAEVLMKMRAVGDQFMGRNYDLYFEWSDDRIYCSELVWKIYDQGAGIKIGQLSKMGSFDLSAPAVQAKIRERFGNNPPLEDTVISPASMFASPNLKTVHKKLDTLR